jgi:hypothetical protein
MIDSSDSSFDGSLLSENKKKSHKLERKDLSTSHIHLEENQRMISNENCFDKISSFLKSKGYKIDTFSQDQISKNDSVNNEKWAESVLQAIFNLSDRLEKTQNKLISASESITFIENKNNSFGNKIVELEELVNDLRKKENALQYKLEEKGSKLHCFLLFRVLFIRIVLDSSFNRSFADKSDLSINSITSQNEKSLNTKVKSMEQLLKVVSFFLLFF